MGCDSAGGVVLATKDGRIVLENTLDARLEVVFKQQLPEVHFHFSTFSVETVNCRKIQDLDFFSFVGDP